MNTVQDRVEHGHQDHCQNSGESQAEHDGDGHGNPEDILQKGNDAEHRGRRCVDHRPQTRNRRLHDRLIGAHALLQVEIDLIQEHHHVLDDHSRQAHGTEECHEAEWTPRHEKTEGDAHGRKGKDQHDEQRGTQCVEKHDDDGEHDHHSRHQPGNESLLRFPRAVVLPAPLEGVARRKRDVLEGRPDLLHEGRRRGVIGRGLNRDRAAPIPTPDQRVFPLHRNPVGDLGQGNGFRGQGRQDLYPAYVTGR